MITYPRNTESKYIVYRVSTQEIIKDNAIYPVAGGGEIPGLDTDYIYLEKIEGARPDYDGRIFRITQTEQANIEDGEWTVSYATEKRQVEEINLAIENEEQNANNQLLPNDKLLKMLLLSIGVLFRQSDSATLNKKEKAIKTRALSLATKVWKNDDSLKSKLQEIAEGKEPNPDSEWETQ